MFYFNNLMFRNIQNSHNLFEEILRINLNSKCAQKEPTHVSIAYVFTYFKALINTLKSAINADE